MNTKRSQVLLYATVVMVLLIISWLIRLEFKKQEVAYIDIGKLLKEYKMKKELEEALNKDLSRIKNVIDSLQLVKKMEGSRITSVDSQLSYAQYAFKEHYAKSSEKISQKVWERLNPDIEAFGKQAGMQLLIGANGTGTVLYGAASNDQTAVLIKYVNERYEKGGH